MPAQTHRLYHKNLYVVPTKTGWAFLGLALVIWLLGTNYQNNLILALAYLQVSLLVMVILNTYNNLSGLTIDCLGSDGGHAGETINFRFRISSANAFGSHYVKLAWGSSGSSIHDFEGSASELVSVGIIVDKRGRFTPPRLLILSSFPMGLVKCWSWLRFDTEVVVYPKPQECPLPSVVSADGDGGGESKVILGGEEFLGYQSYRPGDSLHRIAWKQYARERGLHSKLYCNSETSGDDLNWNSFFNGDVETALSHMTYWALTLHQQGRSFSISLPSTSISYGDGDAHLVQALSALALHGRS